MSATHEPFKLRSVQRERSTGLFSLTFLSAEGPPRPSWIPEDDWYGGSGDQYTFTIPANAMKRATVTAPTGIAKTIDQTTGEIVYHRYTYNGTTWVDPVRCDHMGVPI